MAKPNIGNTWEKQIDEDGAFVRRPTSFHGVCSPDEDAEFPAAIPCMFPTPAPGRTGR